MSGAARLRAWWDRWGAALLVLAAALMLAAALWRLANEVPRLLFDPAEAVDLRLRLREVQRWVAGLPVYGDIERGDYPPASYILLWPLLGWLPAGGARWLWAATTVVALAWLAAILVRESNARMMPQRLVVLLLPFSIYASSATIRVGQLTNHVLPILLAGILALEGAQRNESRTRASASRRREQASRAEADAWRDTGAAALLVAALVKPTLSAPFFWIVCFRPGRLRPIVLVTAGYAALTLIAASFQGGGLDAIFGWLGEGSTVLQGHANIHKWLALAGRRSWMLPVSLVLLLGLGAWVYRHRDADLWILLGVSALIARFWIHHRLYDDLLVLIPAITLFRLARSEAGADGVIAGLLFAATWATLYAPASLLRYPAPVSTAMELGQAAVWLAVLVFLARRADRATGPVAASSEMAAAVSGRSNP